MCTYLHMAEKLGLLLVMLAHDNQLKNLRNIL